MKLHPNLVDAVVNALMRIFGEQQYADKVVEQTLRSDSRWGARDRAFVAENIYEMVRWWRLLWAVYGKIPNPTSAEDLHELFGVHWLLKGYSLPEKEMYAPLLDTDWQSIKTAITQPAIKVSVPDWLYELGSQELGSIWPAEIEALNDEAPVVIRANSLKTTASELQEILAAQKIEVEPFQALPHALVLNKRQNLQKTEAFANGLFEVQDAASQQVAPLLAIKPGMNIIDACAGAGGKTLHLAALSQNKGQITALDVEARKLEELKRRARRAGVTNIKTFPVGNGGIIKQLQASADRLLLDVPCSGLGVLRRNPDAKWKLSLPFIETVRQTQQNILQKYSTMLKPRGIMVYATCSILPSENEQQVELFLQKNSNFEMISSHRLSPASSNTDGFFMAALHRKN